MKLFSTAQNPNLFDNPFFIRLLRCARYVVKHLKPDDYASADEEILSLAVRVYLLGYKYAFKEEAERTDISEAESDIES